MVLLNNKLKHLSCTDFRIFLKKLVKDKIEKEWSEKFVEDINLVLIPRMTIKRRYENKGIDLVKLIYDSSYYIRVKKNVNSRGNIEFGNR